MYLFELTDQERLVKIITITDQLRSALESGKITSNWDVDTLLKYFREYDVVLSPNDLYNMIQQKPLKNVISNIKGKEVIFKGLPQQQEPVEAPPPEQSKDVVAKMAKHAQSK
jgi:hypothetical protein